MDFATLKEFVIQEGSVAKITDSNGIVIWEKVKEIINWARCSINPDGSIYNDGLGYKVGYRVRSGGAEGEAGSCVCIGFAPFKKGDVLRISPTFTGENTGNAINFYDSSFNNLGQVTDNGSTCYGICVGNYAAYKTNVIDGASTLTYTDSFDSRIAYVRVTHNAARSNYGEDLIITINQEIPL